MNHSRVFQVNYVCETIHQSLSKVQIIRVEQELRTSSMFRLCSLVVFVYVFVFVLLAGQSAIKCDHNVYGRLLFFNLSHTIRCRQIVAEAGTDNGFANTGQECVPHTHTNSYY